MVTTDNSRYSTLAVILLFDIAEMWKCLKLLRFSIQTTEKLFTMPNVTFDSNHGNLGARDTATDSRPAGSWYICQIGS